MQVIEHIQGHYDVEDVEFGRVYKWHPGSVVVECVCGERLILVGPVAVQQSESILLECGCGEKFTLAGRVTVRGPVAANRYREAQDFEEEPRYSGLEGCLEWLEGKEARQEYYARLERAASW